MTLTNSISYISLSLPLSSMSLGSSHREYTICEEFYFEDLFIKVYLSER